MSNAWIIDAVRTPRGRGKPGKGSLSGTHPQALLSQTLNRVAERTGIDKKDVEDVVVGCVSQAGEQGANIARNSILFADWPQEVTGVSLNRFCGSGLQAVNFAAMGVMSGQQDLVVGGGVESNVTESHWLGWSRDGRQQRAPPSEDLPGSTGD